MKLFILLSILHVVFICIKTDAEMVTSTVNGTVKYISEKNQIVKKGQHLVKFSESGTRIKIEMLKLDIRQNEELLKDLKTDLNRSHSLQKTSSVSLANHEDVVYEYKKTLIQSEIFKLDMEGLMLMLSLCTISAPYDCKIIKIIIVPNSGVELGQKILEIRKLN